MCEECGKDKVLDENGICRECYIARYGMYAEVCPVCEFKYEVELEHQFVCPNCRPNCKGCTKKFNPRDKHQVLCAHCESKAGTTGFCSYCGLEDELNDFARCKGCAKQFSQSFEKCSCCKTNVSDSTRVCDKCSLKSSRCSRCEIGSKYEKDYVCENCKKTQGKKFRELR